MSGLNYDPETQTRRDGPLTPQFQQRIREAKRRLNLNYGDIAVRGEISSSFLGNITRYETATSTPVATRLAQAIKKLEAGDLTIASNPSDPYGEKTPLAAEPALTPIANDTETIEHALAILRGHGLGVILTAGASTATPTAIMNVSTT